ncbi:MAG: FxsA family protein, partial [Candidatus Binatia bacterium]
LLASERSRGLVGLVSRLLVLFIIVPAVELALLIEIGSRIGTLATLGLIAGTGALGAGLVRSQGLGLLRRVQRELDEGSLPADALVDGVILLVAGALLVTPGVLTDAVGFLCLVPAFRRVVKAWLARRMEAALREGRVHVVLHTEDWPPPRSSREGRPRPVDPDDPRRLSDRKG